MTDSSAASKPASAPAQTPSVAKPDGEPVVAPGSPSPATPNALTPEEQMALFEQDLKEKDWGHQPC